MREYKVHIEINGHLYTYNHSSRINKEASYIWIQTPSKNNEDEEEGDDADQYDIKIPIYYDVNKGVRMINTKEPRPTYAFIDNIINNSTPEKINELLADLRNKKITTKKERDEFYEKILEQHKQEKTIQPNQWEDTDNILLEYLKDNKKNHKEKFKVSVNNNTYTIVSTNTDDEDFMYFEIYC